MLVSSEGRRPLPPTDCAPDIQYNYNITSVNVNKLYRRNSIFVDQSLHIIIFSPVYVYNVQHLVYACIIYCIAYNSIAYVNLHKLYILYSYRYNISYCIASAYVRTCIRHVHTCIRACARTCVRAYVRTCVRAYVRTCVRAYVRTCVRAYVRTCAYTCVYVRVRARTCAYVRVRARTCAYVRVRARTCAYVRVRVRAYVRTCVCVLACVYFCELPILGSVKRCKPLSEVRGGAARTKHILREITKLKLNLA